MASSNPYEGGGGIGGKMRRRPARSHSTPYDRPPTAARGPTAVSPAIDGSNGWLSKLVDPASRFIAGSASKLFSSVFRKSLTAPPPIPASSSPEEMHQEGEEERVPLVMNAVNQVAETPVQTTADATPRNKQKDERDPAEAITELKSFSEIEQLFVQKTFTKEQFEHLTEMLRARVVEPRSSNQAQTSKGKEVEANIPNREYYVAESSRKNVMFATPASTVLIPKEDGASPMELAKAYMSSKSSKASPTTLRLRTPAFIERKPALTNSVVHTATKPPISGSIAQRPDTPLFDQPRDAYPTPRSLGRTAISRMCRSPFVKSGGPSSSGYVAKFSPYETFRESTPGSKLALKRGSSALYDEIGSVGPIRRIRQKLNMTTPLKEPTSSPYKNFVPTRMSALKIDSNHASTSNQKHLQLTKLNQKNDESAHKDGMEDAETETDNINIPSVPPRSTETAMKILNHLEKIVPSPKDKKSETPVLQIEASSSHKQDKLKVDLSKQTKSDGKIMLENNGVGEIGSVASAKSGKSVFDGTSSSIKVPKVAKPAFRMSVPEDCPDDDEEVEATVPVKNVFRKMESSTSEPRKVESQASEKSTTTSEAKAAPSPSFSISSTSKSDKKDLSAPPVSETNTAFKFTSPPTTSPPIKFNLPSAPALSTASLDVSANKDEQAPSPLSNIGLKQQEKPETPVSSWASGNAGAKAEFSISRMPTAEVSDYDRSGQKRKSEDASKLTESATFSASLWGATTFGASASPALSNGTTHSSLPKFSFSAAPAVLPATQPVLASSTPAASSTTTSTNFSSPVPEIPKAPFIQFGASNEASLKTVASPLSGDSSAKTADLNPVKPITFGISTNPSNAGITTAAVQSTTTQSTTTLATSTTTGGLFSSTVAGQSTSATANTPAFSFGNSGKSTTTSEPTFAFGSSATTGSATTSSPSVAFVNSGTSEPVSTNAMTTTTAPAATYGGSGSTGAFTFSASSQPNSSSQTPAFAFGAAAPSSNSATSSFGYDASSSQNTRFATSMPSSVSSQPSFGFGASTGSGFGMKPAQPESTGTQPNALQSQSMSSQFSSPFSSPASSPALFGASVGFSFSSIAPSSSSAAASSSQPGLFGSGSSTTPSAFGTTSFGSNPSSAGFTFTGQSSSPAFSFTGSSNNSSTLGFGLSNPSTNPSTGFGSVSPGGNNDQMSMEDSMVDDTSQAANPNPPVAAFGQPASPVPLFGAPSGGAPAPTFQFGASPSQALFPPGSNLEFNAGNQFSGSGAGDKAGRRFVKVRRDNKNRRK